MSLNSAEALLTVIAVVIFGIFVLLANTLFKTKLQNMLNKIFDDALKQAEKNMTTGA